MFQQWEQNAEAYAQLIAGQGTPHQKEILVPCIDRLLGDVRGAKLLDAGCGEGYLSRRYAKKGASVTGVDISDKMIRLSIEKAERERVKADYFVADICNLEAFPDKEFDKILCNLVFLNVPCFERALQEFIRVLKPNGEVVFSIVHPAFDFYGPGRWVLGEKNEETDRRVGKHFVMDNYFEERSYERVWKLRSGEKFPAPITFFHRTISTYFNTARAAGFVVEELAEPTPETDRPFFEREKRIPVFLVFKLRKINEV